MPGNQPAATPPRSRGFLFAALTACVTMLLILALGETGARLFYRGHPLPKPPPPQDIIPYQANPYVVTMRPYLYFHIPGSRYFQKIGLGSRRNEYQINSMGFRGPEITPLPSPGKRRLLVLGDSVVEGHGVRLAETFPSYLGTRLADREWEAINLGVQGASPLYFAANLERFLYLHPDGVLVLLHENDLYDDELREKSYFSSPFLEDRPGLYTGGQDHSPGASRLWTLLATSWKTLFRSPLEKMIADHGARPGIHAGSESKRVRSSFVVPQEKFAGRWAMSSAYLSYLLDALQRRKITFLLSSLCTVTLSIPADPSATSHCASIEEHARRWAEEHGVPFLSLSPTMQQALTEHKITEVLLRNDYHPTPMTHHLLADALYPFVLGNLPEQRDAAGNDP